MGILDTTDTEFGAIMSNVSHRMPQSQQFEIVDCTYTECTVLSMLPQCTADACQQGRKPCPSPEACMQPEQDDPFPWLTADRFWLLYLATLFILGFVAAGIAWA